MGLELFPPAAGGVPTGNTAARPSNPSIGDVFYNGQKGYLEIYDGTNWIPSSGVPGQPTISVSDVGTSRAYGSAQASVTITKASDNIVVDAYKVYSSTGGYIGNSTTSVVTVTVGNSGTWEFNGTTFSPFGESSPSALVSQSLTTVPQAPSIGAATTSGSTSDVTVNWTLNNNGGKNLTAITITPYLNGTTAQTSQTASTTSSTSHVFTGLTQGSAYTFKVKAANANGDSLESSASTSITVPTFVTIDYLVVGGGGEGERGASGNYGGGGGGGGGMRCTVTATGGSGSLETPLSVATSTNYTVTVGAAGSNSVFANITALRGGGASGYNGVGADGGSGGGGGWTNASITASNYDANQGYAGGNTNEAGKGGGGGGAGGAGNNAQVGGDAGGNGGAGRATSIDGNSQSYAGGGGGGSGPGSQSNANDGGGRGGGGGAAQQAGSANTGGGGGGGGSGANSTFEEKPGGSGKVVLRYVSNRTITVGAGLTSTTNTVGGNKVTAFNAGTGNVSWS